MRISLFIFIYICSAFFNATYASDGIINICLLDCKNKLAVTLKDATEKKLQLIFDDDNMSDTRERQCIAQAIALMEEDVYTQISEDIPGDDLNEKLRDRINNKDDTRNTRNFLIYLLDNQYIRHHLLRRTQQRTQWFGTTETASAIKSLKHATSFAIDSFNTALTHKPQIIEINMWKKAKSIKEIRYKTSKITAKSKPDNTADDVDYDFE